jgi:asparagine synthase (glutamine-hydrolysing)
LPKVVWMYDEPYADGSAMPTYHVSRLAREYVKVVLSGDGGDEVFAGYSWYDRWLGRQRLDTIPTIVKQGLLAPVGRAWPDNLRGGRIKRFLEDMAYVPFEQYARQLELFSPREKRRILGPDWRAEFADYDDYWYFRRYWHPDLDPITRLQYLDLKTYLPDDILTKVDRTSMAIALEVRPPLLDHLLVEAVFRVPATIRFCNAEKKYLLKRCVDGVLPPEILSRKKKGFSSPLLQWFEQEHEWAQAFLESGELVRQGIVSEPLDTSLRGYQKGPKYWALLVLEQWLRSGEMIGP